MINLPVDATGSDYRTEALFAAASIPALVQSVTTAGYYSAGDGGGHKKVRVATPSPVKGWHSQSADGAWWEIREKAIRSQMLGAKADGVTDDTAALQAAFDYAANFGVTVDLVGFCRVRDKLTSTVPISLAGRGRRWSKLIWDSTSTDAGIRIATSGTAAGQYINVRSIGFYSKAAGSWTAIELDYSSTTNVVNSIEQTGAVVDCEVSGLTPITTYWNAGIVIKNCKNVLVERNFVLGGGGTTAARAAARGIYFQHVGGATDYNCHSARIYDNTVTFCNIGCETSDVEGVFVTDNDFQACNYALMIGNVTRQKNQVRLKGNHLDGTTGRLR